jgi:hypothetical protein
MTEMETLRHLDKFFRMVHWKTTNPKYIEKLLYFIHPEGYCRILIVPNVPITWFLLDTFTLMRLIFITYLSVSANSRLQWSQELWHFSVWWVRNCSGFKVLTGEWVRNWSGFKDFNISALGNIFKWSYLFPQSWTSCRHWGWDSGSATWIGRFVEWSPWLRCKSAKCGLDNDYVVCDAFDANRYQNL